jgi:hypothetical protein
MWASPAFALPEINVKMSPAMIIKIQEIPLNFLPGAV